MSGRRKPEFPICTASELFEIAFTLYKNNKGSNPYRSIGVRAFNLIVDETPQLSFLPEMVRAQKNEQLETAIDKIRARYGCSAIQRGIYLTDRKLSNLNPKDDHIIHPIGLL